MNSLYHCFRHTKTKSHRVCRYHGMMLRLLSSLVAPHAMKYLLPFLALVIICFLYHHSLNEAAIMATGKCWLVFLSRCHKYSGGRGARRRHSTSKSNLATHTSSMSMEVKYIWPYTSFLVSDKLDWTDPRRQHQGREISR